MTMSIEHVASQNPDAGPAIPNAGSLGNLVLVPPELNGKILSNKSFDKKKAQLKKARVPLDDSLSDATVRAKDEIAARAKAKLAYEKVFKV